MKRENSTGEGQPHDDRHDAEHLFKATLVSAQRRTQ